MSVGPVSVGPVSVGPVSEPAIETSSTASATAAASDAEGSAGTPPEHAASANTKNPADMLRKTSPHVHESSSIRTLDFAIVAGAPVSVNRTMQQTRSAWHIRRMPLTDPPKKQPQVMDARNRGLRGLVVCVAVVAGCRAPPSNTCTITSDEPPLLGAHAAGCLVVVDGKLLVVRAVQPGSRRHGKLQPPGGGVESGESAQCAAARETEEEAGVAVTVGRRLHTFANGFVLYRCHPKHEGAHAAARTPAVPIAARLEVSEKRLVDPLAVGASGALGEPWAFVSNRIIAERWTDWLR